MKPIHLMSHEEWAVWAIQQGYPVCKICGQPVAKNDWKEFHKRSDRCWICYGLDETIINRNRSDEFWTHKGRQDN